MFVSFISSTLLRAIHMWECRVALRMSVCDCACVFVSHISCISVGIENKARIQKQMCGSNKPIQFATVCRTKQNYVNETKQAIARYWDCDAYTHIGNLFSKRYYGVQHGCESDMNVCVCVRNAYVCACMRVYVSRRIDEKHAENITFTWFLVKRRTKQEKIQHTSPKKYTSN